MVNVIKPSATIVTDIDSDTILRTIESAGRLCYKSEGNIGDIEKTKTFIKGLINRKHFAMLEHQSVTVHFVVDRGVSHEIVRHRIASYAQESTRYCNYSNGSTGSSINVIKPCFFESGTEMHSKWLSAVEQAANAYNELIAMGARPEEARSVLPNSLKTEIYVTMNLREWRHFFELRAIGTTGRPHPQMVEVARPLLMDMYSRIPVVFDDLVEIIK